MSQTEAPTRPSITSDEPSSTSAPRLGEFPWPDGHDLHAGAALALKSSLPILGAGLVVGDGGGTRRAGGVSPGEAVVLHGCHKSNVVPPTGPPLLGPVVAHEGVVDNIFDAAGVGVGSAERETMRGAPGIKGRNGRLTDDGRLDARLETGHGVHDIDE